jgi:hypothetical protein
VDLEIVIVVRDTLKSQPVAKNWTSAPPIHVAAEVLRLTTDVLADSIAEVDEPSEDVGRVLTTVLAVRESVAAPLTDERRAAV